MRIVGLTGYAQHGKNTVAELLGTHTKVVQVGFADSLRILAERVNPYVVPNESKRYSDTLESLGYELSKGSVPEFRRFLQELGTGVRDVLGDDAWVKALEHRIKPYRSQGVTVVVTDVRFSNEAEWVLQHGVLVGVMRTVDTPVAGEEAGWQLYDSGVDRTHPSEAGIAEQLARSDYLLVASDLETLQQQVAQSWLSLCVHPKVRIPQDKVAL